MTTPPYDRTDLDTRNDLHTHTRTTMHSAQTPRLATPPRHRRQHTIAAIAIAAAVAVAFTAPDHAGDDVRDEMALGSTWS